MDDKTAFDIDKDWFLDKLQSRNKSVRGLARHLDIDPSAASRMLAGKRKMKMAEASEVARFLGAPIEEVLRHAGVDISTRDGKPPIRILLAATINASGEVGTLNATSLPTHILRKIRSITTEIEPGTQVIAAEVRARKGPLALWDDAIVFFAVTDMVEKEAIGTLSIVRTRKGVQMLAKVEHARKTGEATIRLPNGQSEDQVLVTATPVLAIIP